MNSTTVLPTSRSAAASQPPRHRRVVDAPMRMFHWLLAFCFAAAYLTAESERWRAMHNTLGYTFAGLLVFRLVYGFVGPRPARWSALGARLRGLPAWWRAVVAARAAPTAPWRQGQNLAMAWVGALMLGLAWPLAFSGVAGEWAWGGARLAGAWESLHEGAANAVLVLVMAHLGLLLVLSLLRRKNQALPMLTGRQPGPGPDLVARNRGALAIAMLVAALALGVLQWRQAPQGLWPAGGLATLFEDDGN